MEYIPDPIELMESRIDRMMDRYIDEYTCMECGKKVGYELIQATPHPDAPGVCIECLGFNPFEDQSLTNKQSD